MLYLAIESSCDETSLAILKYEKNSSLYFYSSINSIDVASSIISSQIEAHKLYGGVVPEIGARLHAEQIHGLYKIVLAQALEKLDLNETEFYNQFEIIFVTTEPGLMSALRVGIEFAKSLKFYILQNFEQQVKIQNTNHLQGHIASSFFKLSNELSLESKKLDLNTPLNYTDSQIFPHLHLMVSGGNTQIRLLRSWTDWEVVGQTIDDAVGECFDKTARMVGIPYPGGATLSKIAGGEYSNPLNLPIAMIHSGNLDISLSGLKTAVRYKIEKANITGLKLDEPLTESEIEELKTQINFEKNPKLQFIKQLCISTQFAIIEQLVRKVNSSIKQYQPNSIGVSGGVSANGVLKSKILELEYVKGLVVKSVFAPDISLTGDNAVMIGLAGLVNLYL